MVNSVSCMFAVWASNWNRMTRPVWRQWNNMCMTCVFNINFCCFNLYLLNRLYLLYRLYWLLVRLRHWLSISHVLLMHWLSVSHILWIHRLSISHVLLMHWLFLGLTKRDLTVRCVLVNLSNKKSVLGRFLAVFHF